jgi:tetratricopeptide (TPR) repeat protein
MTVAGFPREAIEACLERIAASRHFSRSLRLGGFLRFTVVALLEGRGDELKERTIGVEVYGRPLDYDPRTDPIVRSEAHRLRTRLAAYYAEEGSADPLVIEYPKGAYVPALRANATDPARRFEGPTRSRAHDPYVEGRHSVIQYGNTLDSRDLERAQRRLQAALAGDPASVDALAELAHLELMRLYPPRGETARVLAAARALLERALSAAPGHARSLYLLGHVEGSASRPREALRLTESAVAIDPGDSEGRTMLAVRYASLGFWESAVVACDQALVLDPVWDAPYRVKVYLLTRMGRLDAARLAVDELARRGTSPTEVAMARFDLRIAERDFAGARAALASLESTFSLRPDLEDRREIARALAAVLEGRPRDARRKLAAHRGDGPRFWDHTIRLALALGEGELARELLLGNPINRSYRWLASEALVRPHLRRPRWRALADDLHSSWRRDLEEVGPRLPAPPPALPDLAALLRRGKRSPWFGAATNLS